MKYNLSPLDKMLYSMGLLTRVSKHAGGKTRRSDYKRHKKIKKLMEKKSRKINWKLQ